ncbi:MAG: DUF4157 domain-containing protein [Sphingobacteriaceae bacterium]|nr:DUF4157 domain-containing protein [Sphingobacteriaceae bacterium]
MNTNTKRTPENKNQAVSDSLPAQLANSKSTFQLQDNRTQAIVQKRQVEALSNKQTSESLVQKNANQTGLPGQLKSGIENLSGHSMDDVRVHYNSDKPVQLNAHAYAQGTDIHIASGQEKHLAHEAWHVVQQKQGRVKPTVQLNSKVNINDDKGLEKEADVMGAKAAQLKTVQLKGGGSHGKHLHFKVTTITIHNALTGANRFVNANHDEDLGKVPSHGAGPAQKTQADANIVAAGAVHLGANEAITNVSWNHYTSR